MGFLRSAKWPNIYGAAVTQERGADGEALFTAPLFSAASQRWKTHCEILLVLLEKLSFPLAVAFTDQTLPLQRSAVKLLSVQWGAEARTPELLCTYWTVSVDLSSNQIQVQSHRGRENSEIYNVSWDCESTLDGRMFVSLMMKTVTWRHFILKGRVCVFFSVAEQNKQQ